jgi:hypothetical protein
LLNYWTMDTKWLVEQAKLHDLQNRLGFVVTLARSATTPATHNDARQDALESLELSLKRSLLAREESLGDADLSETERSSLKKHRSKEAKQWNLLTNWRPEALRYTSILTTCPAGNYASISPVADVSDGSASPFSHDSDH